MGIKWETHGLVLHIVYIGLHSVSKASKGFKHDLSKLYLLNANIDSTLYEIKTKMSLLLNLWIYFHFHLKAQYLIFYHLLSPPRSVYTLSHTENDRDVTERAQDTRCKMHPSCVNPNVPSRMREKTQKLPSR